MPSQYVRFWAKILFNKTEISIDKKGKNDQLIFQNSIQKPNYLLKSVMSAHDNQLDRNSKNKFTSDEVVLSSRKSIEFRTNSNIYENFRTSFSFNKLASNNFILLLGFPICLYNFKT